MKKTEKLLEISEYISRFHYKDWGKINSFIIQGIYIIEYISAEKYFKSLIHSILKEINSDKQLTWAEYLFKGLEMEEFNREYIKNWFCIYLNYMPIKSINHLYKLMKEEYIEKQK